MSMAIDEKKRLQDEAKRRAAVWAAAQVEDGMAVGLGSGSTSAMVIDEVGKRVKEGLKIVAIATSIQSHEQALKLGITMTDFVRQPYLDLTIDGADEVQKGTLNLIKGHGGALLREKIVAIWSRRLLIAVDPSKIVETMGSVFALPVEVVPFGWETTQKRLKDLGLEPELRVKEDGSPYVTDGQHYILHCGATGAGRPLEEMADAIKSTVGVVEHGLFLGMANKVVIGAPEKIEVLEPVKS